MSDNNNNGLTAGELRVLLLVCEFATNLNQLNVDFEGMAKKAGLANAASAGRRWRDVKAKLIGGATTSTPTKRKREDDAVNTPTQGKKKARATTGDGGSDDDTPAESPAKKSKVSKPSMKEESTEVI